MLLEKTSLLIVDQTVLQLDLNCARTDMNQLIYGESILRFICSLEYR